MKTVLFVCFHNAGRSQMAEAFFNRFARERGLPLRALSAGTLPKHRPETCEDWNLEDPAGQPIEKVREIRDRIQGKVEALINDLQGAPW